MNYQALKAAFGHADSTHFEWQTRSKGVAERERALVRKAFLPLRSRILDLGSGEGATLYHLDEPVGAQGIELFPDKVRFAQERLKNCLFQEGSVYELPFEDNSFDQLIVRDVVHHLEQPSRMFAECARVLETGGRIDVLEPCRYNALVLGHALTNRVERGELKSTPNYLQHLLEDHFHVEQIERHQALPIHRLVYHPSLGNPLLAQRPWVQRLVDNTEDWAARLLPRWTWAYIHVRAFLQ